ncbi:MAG: LapA family protein [Succinivibrio sp.]
MLKFWLYFFVLIFLVIVGLAIGAANDSIVSFDFLVAKKEVSIATVLVVGIVFGFILGIYSCLLLCLKLWFKARVKDSAVKKLRKQNNELKQQPES